MQIIDGIPVWGARMTLRNKILLTVIAAVVYFFLTQLCPHPVPAEAQPAFSVFELQNWYKSYNEDFFNGKLPENVIITYDEHDERFMAQTNKQIFSDGFKIDLNPDYAKAARVSLYLILHEMCHEYAWGESQGDKAIEHGPKWRTCMVRLDVSGAFKPLLIDGYSKK